MNMVRYERDVWDDEFGTRLFVSTIEFNRNMSQIVEGTVDIKTMVFPSTIRETSEETFSDTSVQSAILNEGLETIGEDIFCNSKIKRITIPKSITRIESEAFENCNDLK